MSGGRPRSAEADEAILQAALELLAESGYRALTMEKVRASSGVGKATIYRRYGSKEELVAAAIVHLNSDIPLPDDTGTLQGDFAATAQSVLQGAARTRCSPGRNTAAISAPARATATATSVAVCIPFTNASCPAAISCGLPVASAPASESRAISSAPAIESMSPR